MTSFIQFLQTNWDNRNLTSDLIKRDFKIKYLGSLFGSYWNLIHPLAMISIYTVIFSQVMKSRLGETSGPFDFTLYLCAGLLPWLTFTEIVTRSTQVFHDNTNLIKKISFPKEILHTVVIGTSLITLTISLGLYFMLVFFTQHGFSWHLIFALIALFSLVLFGAGLGMILGVLNAFFKDVQQFVQIIFQVWFWLTPIVYATQNIPNKFLLIIQLNPTYHIIQLFQCGLYYKTIPPVSSLVISLSCSFLTFIMGVLTLNHFKDEILDVV